jgi:hypothetical protein
MVWLGVVARPSLYFARRFAEVTTVRLFLEAVIPQAAAREGDSIFPC